MKYRNIFALAALALPMVAFAQTKITFESALVEEGDLIKIDIPNYSLELLVDEKTLALRRNKKDFSSKRSLTGYLKRYAALVSSADKGAKLC